MNTSTLFFQALCLGIGATIVMDIWLLILKIFKVPTLNFAFLGRWVGWIAHYSVGIIFALSFLLIVGSTWFDHPQFYSALLFGLVTVLIPFFIMQPAMGSGFASSKTAHPFLNCLKSLLNHSVFGCGLYLTAKLFQI
ncbi:TPA: DUF2938 family protein [Acinetobacter baumannii]|uniref:DUF2938 family protein n=1 Tax=Acinetobacter baumannii TaxID=470 RepID=UPI0015EC9625|nr:DUF2938 family protein [Acinetobacter baumannii]MBA2956857.1 DUF2938 family protein [Acinetobacter baumannii]MBA2973183.1 DUF2938 family protein [Acinetobacter baumannii]MCJ9115659.1 DUF2938 domain-containing protein [Acinetobacter baumannii]MDP7800703.1 DUF2938 family protein [Acinetobacter baumannii]HAV2877187.1 DUF2938 domain-containing protein [Acinetobacter baumannii]